MTGSCEFNTQSCNSKCESYTFCSLLHTEKHLNSLENKVIEIFKSLNELIQFSSESGKNILEIQNIIPHKDDVIDQFSLVYEEINNLKTIVLTGNTELKKLILEYSEEIKKISSRLATIEKISLPEKR